MKEFVEKLIGRLEELKSNPNEKTCRENILLAMQKNLTIYSAIEIVNQLAEEYNNGWISCEERLPESHCWTITCDKEGNIHMFFYRDGYFHESYGGKTITEQNERFYVPIAWMPLPETYQKGE